MASYLDTLRGFGRPALQKLAKKYDIKGNLKSEVIIDLLLQRKADVLGPLEPNKPTSHQGKSIGRRQTTSPAHQTKNSSASVTQEVQAADLPTMLQDSQADIEMQPQLAPRSDPAAEQQPILGQEDEVQSVWSVENYQWNTPESSRANTPEPEADPELLKATVDHMVYVEADTARMREQVEKCREMTQILELRAIELRTAARAERACAERLRTYFNHWHETKPGWSHEQVWGGQMTIDLATEMEITESDEEEQEESETEERPSKEPPAYRPGEEVAQETLEAGPGPLAGEDVLSKMLDQIAAEGGLDADTSSMDEDSDMKTFNYLFTGPVESMSKYARLAIMLERSMEGGPNPHVLMILTAVKRFAIKQERMRLAETSNLETQSLKRTRTEAGLDVPPEAETRGNPRQKIAYGSSQQRSAERPKPPPPTNPPQTKYTPVHLILSRMKVPRPAWPRLGHVDKGKRKMTAQEVDRMQQEELDRELALSLCSES